MRALDALFRYIGEHSGEALEFSSREDADDKILHGAIWTELRLKASAALVEFGRPLDTISIEEIEKGESRATK